jgi:hypothetical protein
MKAIKAIYQDGQLKLTEPAPDKGPVEVMVIFPELGRDPWAAILDETTLRPAFAEFMTEALQEIEAGKAEPVDLSKL